MMCGRGGRLLMAQDGVMNQGMLALVVLGIIFCTPLVRSEDVWKLRVFEGRDVHLHVVSQIDSVKFFEAIPPTEGFVFLRLSRYIMGDGTSGCAEAHEVTLTRDFYLGDHEVTNQEYLEVLQ